MEMCIYSYKWHFNIKILAYFKLWPGWMMFLKVRHGWKGPHCSRYPVQFLKGKKECCLLTSFWFLCWFFFFSLSQLVWEIQKVGSMPFPPLQEDLLFRKCSFVNFRNLWSSLEIFFVSIHLTELNCYSKLNVIQPCDCSH